MHSLWIWYIPKKNPNTGKGISTFNDNTPEYMLAEMYQGQRTGMRIEYFLIRNFKSIRELEINDIEDVLILVGRNNAGKSVVLDAIRAVTGDYEVSLRDFNDNEGNISITVRISIEDEDLAVLYQKGQVSSFKHYDLWYKDFCNKLPSLKDGILEFEYVYSRDGKIKYRDGVKKNNIYIKTVLPRIFYVDHERRKSSIQEDLIMLAGWNGICRS